MNQLCELKHPAASLGSPLPLKKMRKHKKLVTLEQGKKSDDGKKCKVRLNYVEEGCKDLPFRVSGIPLSDLSELRPMERSHNPGIKCTVQTVASSESQLDPNLSIPSLSSCHLYPSPICTCTPAFKCLGKGREAPRCSCSISST